MGTTSDDLTTLREALDTLHIDAPLRSRSWERRRDTKMADALEALDRLAAHLARLEVVAAALPQCSGEWTGGSGGHRVHSPCGRIATFYDAGGMWSYCDAHKKPHDDIDEADWADAVRALDAPAAWGEENPG